MATGVQARRALFAHPRRPRVAGRPRALPSAQSRDTVFGYTHMGGVWSFGIEVFTQVFFTLERAGMT
eukprot:gene7183-5854_t